MSNGETDAPASPETRSACARGGVGTSLSPGRDGVGARRRRDPPPKASAPGPHRAASSAGSRRSRGTARARRPSASPAAPRRPAPRTRRSSTRPRRRRRPCPASRSRPFPRPSSASTRAWWHPSAAASAGAPASAPPHTSRAAVRRRASSSAWVRPRVNTNAQAPEFALCARATPSLSRPKVWLGARRRPKPVGRRPERPPPTSFGAVRFFDSVCDSVWHAGSKALAARTEQGAKKMQKWQKEKRALPGIPTWSPTVVLTGLDRA